MATKLQYEVFKTVYDEETERFEALESRSKLYLTIISLYLGALAFKMDEVLKFLSTFKTPAALYIFMIIGFIISLLFTIFATRIRPYEGICDLEQVVDSFGADPPSDEDFLDNRLADLVVATNRNSIENDKMAAHLRRASYALVFAVVMQLFVFLVASFHSRG